MTRIFAAASTATNVAILALLFLNSLATVQGSGLFDTFVIRASNLSTYAIGVTMPGPDMLVQNWKQAFEVVRGLDGGDTVSCGHRRQVLAPQEQDNHTQQMRRI